MSDKPKFKITVTHGGKSSKKDNVIEIENDQLTKSNEFEIAFRESPDIRFIVDCSRNDNSILYDLGILPDELIEESEKDLNNMKANRQSIYTNDWAWNHFYFDCTKKFKEDVSIFSSIVLAGITWVAENHNALFSTFDSDVHFHYIRINEDDNTKLRCFSYMTIVDEENCMFDNFVAPFSDLMSDMTECEFINNVNLLGVDVIKTDEDTSYIFAVSFDLEYNIKIINGLKKLYNECE